MRSDRSTISSLPNRLRERIKRDGPISFRDWMQAALYDECDGYYSTHEMRQGRAGDYRTAPESSSLFAATFARYFARLFAELGSPAPFTIIEVGAGTGEFAHGVLATLHSKHQRVFAATEYVIEELGAGSRERCVARLSEFGDRVTVESPSVNEGLQLRPDGWTRESRAQIIFSNELIDAFPIHRVTMKNGALRELCVGVDGHRFIWIDCDPDSFVAAYCRQSDMVLAEGQTVEISPEADRFVEYAAASLEDGYLITVDYGAERNELRHDPARRGGTLRGFYRHQLIGDVLLHPGEIDLTTTIDWTQMKEAGARAQLEAVRFERLDQFLLAEGALEELEETAGQLTAVDALRLRTSAREMILPHGLAASFQVLVQRKARPAS